MHLRLILQNNAPTSGKHKVGMVYQSTNYYVKGKGSIWISEKSANQPPIVQAKCYAFSH